jgi:hypothetical protein
MSPAAHAFQPTEGPNVLFPSRRARTALAALAAVLLASLLTAGSALADSATISITDTTGKSDPATGLPRTYTVSGTTSAPKNIYIKVRNPGPTPCGPTAESDSGTWWNGYDDYTWAKDANGNYSFSNVGTTSLNGTYMFCIWVAADEESSVTAVTQMITFRLPTGTISATINPVTPVPGQAFAVTINGVSEAPENVYALIRGAGTPCSQTYDADDDLTRDDYTLFGDYRGGAVNGNYTLSQTVAGDKFGAGDYVLCLWLADSSTDATPVAGPQPIPFTIASPPPPPPPPPVVDPRQSTECKAAKKKVVSWTKKVKTTKKSLLHARRKATRRKLTKRLKSQRTSLKSATRKARTICG